jgi:hypothetical protein
VRKPEGRNHLKDLVEKWSIILKWFFKKSIERASTGCVWLWLRTSGKILEFCSGGVRK